MDNVYVGKIVNTHGIKGEIRIVSDFELKEKVFKVGSSVIINSQEFIIESYRVHKNFDMITLKGFNDINQVIPFKGLNLFVKRGNLSLDDDEYLMEDLIGMKVLIDGKIFGEVKDYNRGQNSLLHVSYNEKSYYIPLKGGFIQNINLEKKEIEANQSIKELML